MVSHNFPPRHILQPSHRHRTKLSDVALLPSFSARSPNHRVACMHVYVLLLRSPSLYPPSIFSPFRSQPSSLWVLWMSWAVMPSSLQEEYRAGGHVSTRPAGLPHAAAPARQLHLLLWAIFLHGVACTGAQRFQHLWNTNEKHGSFYLLSKVYRSMEAVDPAVAEMARQDYEAARTREHVENPMGKDAAAAAAAKKAGGKQGKIKE